MKKNRYATRDYALLLLMARHGLRVSEAITLHREQIDFATSNLAVRRLKNGTPSTHPLGGIELRALRKLFRESQQSAFARPGSMRSCHSGFIRIWVDITRDLPL